MNSVRRLAESLSSLRMRLALLIVLVVVPAMLRMGWNAVEERRLALEHAYLQAYEFGLFSKQAVLPMAYPVFDSKGRVRGAIGLRSEPGKGSTFRFTLPIDGREAEVP